MNKSIPDESGDDSFNAFDIDTLRRELLGSLAIIDKRKDDLRYAIANLPDDPESMATLAMGNFTEIEDVANYAGRLLALYAHRRLGVSLARLSTGVTPSALRRRIMNDEKAGIERPERFELARDSDAIGPNLTRYEILCRESTLHPWPASIPLPSRRERQLRKDSHYRPETWELHRADFYRRNIEENPEAKEQYPFGEPGTPEPPAPNLWLDPKPGTTNESPTREKE